MVGNAIIQIQPMLRLNVLLLVHRQEWHRIQIQPMLRLNPAGRADIFS